MQTKKEKKKIIDDVLEQLIREFSSFILSMWYSLLNGVDGARRSLLDIIDSFSFANEIENYSASIDPFVSSGQVWFGLFDIRSKTKWHMVSERRALIPLPSMMMAKHIYFLNLRLMF